MKKTTIAYLVGAVAVVTAVALILKPETGETPVVDVLAPVAAPAPGAANEIKAGLVGTWKSADDSKYSVTFYEDGTVSEQYEDTESGTPLADSNGRWLMMIENETITLVTTFGDEKTFAYSIVAYEDGKITLRELNAIRDNRFIKEVQ
jgi:hypothetical protein